jgi:hypothetical protein
MRAHLENFNSEEPMQHLSRTQLLAARDALRRVDVGLARVRGIFISAGDAPDAAAVNALIDRIAHLLARIDKVLMAKP